ncbi:unnamed protein product [Caenorhabditis nigoni]
MTANKMCDGNLGPFSETKFYNFIMQVVHKQMDQDSTMFIENALKDCSPAEKQLAETACRRVFKDTRSDETLAYGLCCHGLEVCSEVPMIPCSDISSDSLDRHFFIRMINGAKMKEHSLRVVKKYLSTCTPENKKGLQEKCDAFLKMRVIKEEGMDKEGYGYGICCETLNMCPLPFYTQVWFFAVCGGVGLLIIIGIIGIVYFFCIRKKKVLRNSRGGSKSSESTSKKSRK